MSFSQTAGTAIVPTLARIVLAVAFVTAGYNKLRGEAVYTAPQMEALGKLNVTLRPVSPAVSAVVPVRFVQDDPVEPAPSDDEAKTPPPDEPAPSGDAPDDQAAPAGEDESAAPDEPSAVPAEGGDQTYSGKPLYKIALLVDGAGWPNPVLLAWLAALTELLGGAMLLLGLLSRIWGLGLAIAMGVAFYLTSLEPYFAQGWFSGPFNVAASDIPMFNRVFAQLALFVLAFGVLLTGPGPLSLDRLFFGRREKPASGEVRFDRGGGQPPRPRPRPTDPEPAPPPRPL